MHLTYSNTQRFDNMPFHAYINLIAKGEKNYSHSFLKSEIAGTSPIFIITEKVKLGKMVDGILTSPDEVDPAENPQMFKQACKIASSIKVNFKGMIEQFKPQISYTADLSYKGLVLPVCGRLDWLLERQAVLDLKVTEAKTDKEFAAIIRHMGYGNQMFNYMGLAGVKVAYLMPYSTKANACLSVVKVEWTGGANSFWENSVIKFGK